MEQICLPYNFSLSLSLSSTQTHHYVKFPHVNSSENQVLPVFVHPSQNNQQVIPLFCIRGEKKKIITIKSLKKKNFTTNPLFVPGNKI